MVILDPHPHQSSTIPHRYETGWPDLYWPSPASAFHAPTLCSSVASTRDRGSRLRARASSWPLPGVTPAAFAPANSPEHLLQIFGAPPAAFAPASSPLQQHLSSCRLPLRPRSQSRPTEPQQASAPCVPARSVYCYPSSLPLPHVENCFIWYTLLQRFLF
jgi:hypothetical protein